ncbi:MAG: PepSY-like domain-containing protein [Bacteroidales bacterium]
MKNTMRLVALIAVLECFILISNPLFGQKLKSDDVPDDVIQTMEFEYPNVKVFAWNIEDNLYIANFKEESSVGKAYISKNGKWVKTTYNIPKNELPSAITDYVKNNYTNYAIDLSLLQEMPDVRLHYYIEAKPEGVGVKSSVLTFNEVGSLIKRIDPEDFGKVTEPKETAQKTVEKPDSKSSTSKTPTKSTPQTASKPASQKESSSTSKAVTKAATKPAVKSTPKPEVKAAPVKPAAPVTNKQTVAKAQPAPKTAPKVEKKESKKKEKLIEPVQDEFGNVALDPAKVPADLSKALTKKIQRPEELNWFKIDTFYVAKCVVREQKNEFFFTIKGIWCKTYVHLPEERVTGNMLTHLKSFYKGYKFKEAVKEIRADKQDKTMVEIYEKDNAKNKLVTTIIFDKTGKLIKTIDPNYALDGNYENSGKEDAELEKYYEKMNMMVDESSNKDIPKEVINIFKAKYPRVTNVEWKEEDQNYHAIYYGARGKEICVINSYGTILETQSLGNPENLPESIQNALKDYKGYKLVEYYAVKKVLDKKNFYKVLISNKKTKEEQEVWFTTAGKPIEM